MNRYWARFTRSGEMDAVMLEGIGKHFFHNAAQDGMRVAKVVITEVPMTPEEASLANACPACGQQRSTSNQG